MHSFAGDVEQAKKFVNLGLLIGLSGPITFKNGINQKLVAKEIDLTKLLLETDGPYLTPVPFRGKVNRPEYIKYVAMEIAEQKNMSLEQVLATTKQNTIKIFSRELNE